MAFFLPRTIYHSQASSPLYRLLSDVDRLSRRNQDVCYVYRPVAPRPWQPRFEAQETANVFLIRGELPGLAKENITVDFPEPQKMVIRGKLLEASQEAPAQPAVEPTHVEPEVPASPTPAPASPVSDDARSRSSYQATVEDDDENDDFDVVSDFSEKEQEKPQQRPAPEPAKEVKPQPTAEVAKGPAPEQTQSKPAQRVIREFSQTYTFPSPVDYEGTTADFKDGRLTIVVPKPKKPEPRRITIS